VQELVAVMWCCVVWCVPGACNQRQHQHQASGATYNNKLLMKKLICDGWLLDGG
jgi:hypothetical protein